MKNGPKSERPRTPEGHFHKEAFCLMWYACVGVTHGRMVLKPPCGHQERIWNSRDGVTPFTTMCPSCGATLQHVDWVLDRYAPNHTPIPGQRQWIDMTRERQAQIYRKRALALKEHYPECFDEKMIDEEHIKRTVDIDFEDGTPPDLYVTPAGSDKGLRAALERILNMYDRMIKKTNTAASFYDAETIYEMNQAPLEARRVLDETK